MKRVTHNKETCVKAKLIILPEYLNYDDYDLTNADEVYDLIKSKSVRPYIIVFRDRVTPVIVDPRNIDITLEDLKMIIKWDGDCYVAIQPMKDVKYDHNSECLRCDCWPSDCECWEARIENGKALIYPYMH